MVATAGYILPTSKLKTEKPHLISWLLNAPSLSTTSTSDSSHACTGLSPSASSAAFSGHEGDLFGTDTHMEPNSLEMDYAAESCVFHERVMHFLKGHGICKYTRVNV